MKLIYIWKSDKPISSTSNKIKFVRGATWWLEEHTTTSKSYEIMNYEIIGDGIVYLVEERPVDWTGTDYLETLEVDYLANKDTDQVGIWSRWMSGMPVSGMDEALALVKEKFLYGFSSGKKE